MYPLKLHTNLTREKWEGYSTTQQVLMIANEMNRASNCLKSNHPEDAGKCFERAMELTDMTVDDLRWRGKLKELLRFREVLSELYLTMNPKMNSDCLSALLSFNVEAWNMLAVR